MNFKFKHLLPVIVSLVLISCAAILPKEHLIPKAQLVETMQKQFPLHWDKGVLNITVAQPQLNLLPGQNRISMNGHFLAHAALVDIEGDFTGSSKLRYDPAQRAVYLQATNLDALTLKRGNNFAEMLRPQISRLLNDYAAGHPVYRFKPDELVVLGMKVDVGDIGVVADGVMLQLHAVQ